LLGILKEMRKRKNISLIQPKPYQEVGARFIISGWVPKSWLITDFGSVDNRIFLDFIAIDGKTFMGSSINFEAPKGWLSKFRKKLYFSGIA